MGNIKYLPIGSVVILKNATKRIMITGYCSVSKNDSHIYDYSGCLYPEGFLSSSQTCLFDHSQIDKIFFEGFVDDEQNKFMIQLNNLVKNMSGINTNDDNLDDSIPTFEE